MGVRPSSSNDAMDVDGTEVVERPRDRPKNIDRRRKTQQVESEDDNSSGSQVDLSSGDEQEQIDHRHDRHQWDELAFRRHLVLPHIISGYLQLSFNIILIAFVLYALGSFVSSIRGDIDTKVGESAGTIVAEIAECLANHRANRCGTVDEVPALRATCAMWERCMARDPTIVARTKLSAHTIGEILNNFVEPLSYKAMGFFTLFLFGFVIASNIAFKLGASKPALATAERLVPEWRHDDRRLMISPPPPPTTASSNGGRGRRRSLSQSAYRRAELARY